MNRIPRILIAFFLSLITVSLALSAGATAFAVQAVAHGQGVIWKVDHTSWLGNYELDDGNFGYCIDVTRPAPHGADFDYVDGSDAGWFSADDSARLAFISRRWGAPGDPLTAAAAQLAVWTITGLAGHDQAYFAQRANDDADLVIQAANHMLQVANGGAGASRGASATAELVLEGSKGSVVSQLTADYLSGPEIVTPGSFAGRMTLHGATFDGGGTTALVGNGVVTRIHPEQSGATEQVSVDVVYDDLPFGSGFRLGRNTGDSQNLLVTQPFPTSARASDAERGPTGLPFGPQVQTTTSSAIAEPGATLTDTLELGVHPDSPTGDEWGVYRAPDGSFAPIPVVIESVLLGPFPARPVESDAAPADAPVVCTVESVVETGPGTLESPPCEVPEAGFYVWTDSIDPARTPFEKGGDRLMAWASKFGVASETTVVPASPQIATVASAGQISDHGCVSDRLTVDGFPEGAEPITVTSTLLGPLTDRPAEGSTPKGWIDFPVAGTVTTAIATNGTHETPCIPVTAPGFYYFVFESAGSDPSARADSPALIPAFSDSRVHESESVAVSAPTTPPAPEASPTPPVSARLPQTGGGGTPTVMSTVLAVCAVIAGLAGLGLTSRRWR
ncbi:hypothetical protein [Herbiconiux ginsengi]|uniref:LPXTG-motif cell wall anchor domain-containing protein n=1 Tax=Herbiconiux ginsengi TaxID=381665 RepID=A0A1H3JUY9_9MICO|nr:hypothetical protein [Herbiconiux ginsengi]SDY43429.1 hypothetical protein SAMN05216554_0310 [Herbiconiux ginsengi]